MKGDSLGDRMKKHEKVFRTMLPTKQPVIIRVDGRAFHTLTRGLEKPFDKGFIESMKNTAIYFLNNVQNCKMAYVQSDEISLLLDDRATDETDSFFGNNLQKIVSITAAMATRVFNVNARLKIQRVGIFDSRAFIMPDADLPNYFLWRMQDWYRNSIQMLARSMYSQKELHKKNRSDMMDMMMEKGVNWAKIAPHLRNGTLLIKQDGKVKEISRKINYKQIQEVIERL